MGFVEKVGKKFNAAGNVFCRWRAHRGLCAVCAVVLAGGVLVVGSLHVGGVSGNDPLAHSGEQGNVLEVVLACEGWTDDNVEAGVFVSSSAEDGEPIDEQLLFRGSGIQSLRLAPGNYEVVPQLPQIMISDGTVLEASEPLAIRFETTDGGSDRASVAYEIVDASVFDGEALDSIAASSFIEDDIVDQALTQAREKSSS